MNSPRVSVCVVTFNHEKYIRECLQSIVDQEADFYFEVIVGDDFSQDGTREIILEFQNKYPEIIKPILRDSNIGVVGNYMDIHSKASGEYVSHVDGDDFLLPGKLQKQVDKFNSDSSLNILWHRMLLSNTEKSIQTPHPRGDSPFVNKKLTRRDLMLYGSVGSHSSMMYRKKYFSLRYKNFPTLDWLIAVDVISDGFGLVMPEILGTYRVHSGGVSGGASSNKKMRNLFTNCQLEAINRFPEFKTEVSARSFMLMIMDMVAMNGFFINSFKVFIKAMKFPKISLILDILKFYKYTKLPKDFKKL